MSRNKKIITEVIPEEITIDNSEVSEDYYEGTVDLFEKEVINSLEEVKPIEKTLNYEHVKSIDYVARGFETLEDAFEFTNTPYFKGLGKEDQDEFINWLY